MKPYAKKKGTRNFRQVMIFLQWWNHYLHYNYEVPIEKKLLHWKERYCNSRRSNSTKYKKRKKEKKRALLQWRVIWQLPKFVNYNLEEQLRYCIYKHLRDDNIPHSGYMKRHILQKSKIHKDAMVKKHRKLSTFPIYERTCRKQRKLLKWEQGKTMAKLVSFLPASQSVDKVSSTVQFAVQLNW